MRNIGRHLSASLDWVPATPTVQDELIDLLGGADNVAELTGRKSRMVRGKDGAIRFLSRASHNIPLDQVRICCCASTFAHHSSWEWCHMSVVCAVS